MKKLKKAVFLDRDGVVNEDTGWPHRPEQIVFTPGIFDFCLAAAAKGYLLVIVTNQSGVARGYFTEDDVRKLHAWMAGRFREEGVEIAGFYYCPFHPEGTVGEYARESDDRKPGPGMFLKAAEELSIDLSQSVMVGDKQSDRIRHPGITSYILKSRYALSGYDAETLGQIADLL
jgi:D-glycero-D-manno-heptose 1,7-bisphosphate phosphatase